MWPIVCVTAMFTENIICSFHSIHQITSVPKGHALAFFNFPLYFFNFLFFKCTESLYQYQPLLKLTFCHCKTPLKYTEDHPQMYYLLPIPNHFRAFFWLCWENIVSTFPATTWPYPFLLGMNINLI